MRFSTVFRAVQLLKQEIPFLRQKSIHLWQIAIDMLEPVIALMVGPRHLCCEGENSTSNFDGREDKEFVGVESWKHLCQRLKTTYLN